MVLFSGLVLSLVLSKTKKQIFFNDCMKKRESRGKGFIGSGNENRRRVSCIDG